MTTNPMPEAPVLSSEVLAIRDDLIALRRELHQEPEAAGAEHETARRLREAMLGTGVAVETIAGCGLLLRVDSGRPGRRLLLRADLDGLPLTEQTGLPFASRRAGWMHACGHDAHAAMLACAVRCLAASPPERGEVVALFQPAEERGQGMAAALGEGLLERQPADGALALHVWSGYPTGELVAFGGPAMASVDGFSLRLTGRGGHAAAPQETRDPIAAAAAVIGAAQSLVSRRRPPHQPAVLSFTSIHGGSTYNVIPEGVELLGTLRTFDEQVRVDLLAEFERLTVAVAGGWEVRAEFAFAERLPVLVNDPELAALAAREACAIVGPARVVSQPRQLLAGEDFSLLAQKIPAAMVFLGCGGSGAAPHHNPAFRVDEDALPIGLELILRFTRAFCAA